MPAEQREIWDARLTRFDTVMDEDYENLEPIQRSMETAAHGGQVINYQERRIWHVQAWIDKVIGPERIPEHLRVPDLLADWVEPTLPGPSADAASGQVRPAAMNWPVTACWLAWRWSIRRPTAAMCSASPDS